jgi:hypothetical protein
MMPEQAAVEVAAWQLGGLAAELAQAPGSISDALEARLVGRIIGEPMDAAELACPVVGTSRDAERARVAEALLHAASSTRDGSEAAGSALEIAGFGDLRTAAARDDEGRRAHGGRGIVAAAEAAGAIVVASPGNERLERAAGLVAAVHLARAGSTVRAIVAPVRLDAATRSAAVQLERSGASAEWTRAWCVLLARDAERTRVAVATARARMAEESAAVGARPRVGATDQAVLGWLHGNLRFSIREATAALGLTTPTVGTAIARLGHDGIAAEVTGQQRDRVWVATALLDLLAT